MGHFVEQVAGGGKSTAFRVHGDEIIGEESAVFLGGGVGRGNDEGVCGFSKKQVAGGNRNAKEREALGR